MTLLGTVGDIARKRAGEGHPEARTALPRSGGIDDEHGPRVVIEGDAADVGLGQKILAARFKVERAAGPGRVVGEAGVLKGQLRTADIGGTAIGPGRA